MEELQKKIDDLEKTVSFLASCIFEMSMGSYLDSDTTQALTNIIDDLGFVEAKNFRW